LGGRLDGCGLALGGGDPEIAVLLLQGGDPLGELGDGLVGFVLTLAHDRHDFGFAVGQEAARRKLHPKHNVTPPFLRRSSSLPIQLWP
jgi:hypothetical protein